MSALFASDALLPTGWARDVLLRWDAAGALVHVQPDAVHPEGVALAQGPVLPGLPNLHSHAFQRGMAGLTEYRGAAEDSFWSWRTLMYRFANKLDPALLEAIAFGLYVEMLEAGYTSVCEFHYVHHDRDGRPYADDAELALALLRAAQRAGIGLTLLPVLYQASGFGAKPPGEGQRRFIRSTDNMLRLLERLRPLCAAQGARLGLAPHSLRAVPHHALREAVAGLHAQDATAPVHIHIAEQTQEPTRSWPGCWTTRPWMRAGASSTPRTWMTTSTAVRPPAAPWPACAPAPRPTSATACSTGRPGRPRAAPGAWARTATPASTRPRSSCCSSTASAWPRAGAT